MFLRFGMFLWCPPVVQMLIKHLFRCSLVIKMFLNFSFASSESSQMFF